MKSMTGFGRGEAEKDGRRFTVEIKTVNHRYFEPSVRISRQLAALENEVRTLVKQTIVRGKTDIFISYTDLSDKQVNVVIKKGLLKSYVDALKEAARENDLQDDLSGPGIQRARGLISHQDRRFLRQRPGNGYPLLFAAGHLRREFFRVLLQAHLFQHFHGIRRIFHNVAGKRHIFNGGQTRKQIVELEYEADLFRAVPGKLPVIHGGQFHPVHDDLAGGWAVHPAQHIQYRGFSGAGLSEDHHKLPFRDLKTHVIHGDLHSLAFPVGFQNISEFYNNLFHSYFLFLSFSQHCGRDRAESQSALHSA